MAAAYNPGGGRDAVSLVFGGHDARIFTSYTVRKSIITQPAQFTIKLGYGELKKSGQTVADLMKLAPPETPFQLYINNALQQTGKVDGQRANGDATELEIHGRDVLRAIHDAYLRADIGFADTTYTALTLRVFDMLGITAKLASSNAANRKLTTGVGIQELAAPTTVDEIEPNTDAPTNKTVRRSITAKLGETYFAFLQRQYRRAGLFLWAAGDGSFVLSEPNSKQAPTFRIVRQRGQYRNAVSTTAYNFNNDTTKRYTSALVYGRGGGGKFGRAKALGEFVDAEMFNLLGGDVKPITYRDVNVGNQQQAEFYARRKLAEFNRAAWQLQYTFPGHTAPNIQTGLPAVWQPDTMCEVIDDELGLRDLYYIEEVVFTRPPTKTTITLMRVTDLIFGSDE